MICVCRFGELNIPRVIEAALRKLQERAQERSRVMGNVRDPAESQSHSHGPSASPWEPPHATGKSGTGAGTGAGAGSSSKRSPFSGGVIDLSKISLDRNHGTTNLGHDVHPHGGDKRASTPAIAPPKTWDTGSLSQGGSGRGNPFVQNNDILRMKSSFRFDGPGSRRAGSNLRTFEDKTLDVGQQAKPTTPVPGEIQNLFQRLNIASLDSLGAQLDAMSPHQAEPIAVAPLTPNTMPIVVATPAPKTGVMQLLPQMPPIDPLVKASATMDARTGKSSTPILMLNQTAKVNAASAKTNSTTNTTSTKSVKTKTIKVTTVVKGGTSADVAAAAASQAEIANAVAQGKNLTSSNIASIAAAATSKLGAKVIGSQFPVGSITVKRQKNGESIITLSDGQGEPVVLRASGPVKIERIVKPNGKVQFLINPVKPAQLTSTLDPAEADVEAEDITTMSTSNLVTFFSSAMTSPIPLVTRMAKAVMKDALQSGVSEITGTDNSKTNKALVDAALEQAFSSFVSPPLETTTMSTAPSTLLVTSQTGIKRRNEVLPSEPASNTNTALSSSLVTAQPVKSKNAFRSDTVVHATNDVGSKSQPNLSRNRQEPIKRAPANSKPRLIARSTTHKRVTNTINPAFTDHIRSKINNNGVMQLFPALTIPKIPPPPRVIGSIFSNSGGLMNSILLNNLGLFSDPKLHSSLHKTDVTTSTASPPRINDVNATTSLEPRPDIMPKYDLINNAPNVDFATHTTHG